MAIAAMLVIRCAMTLLVLGVLVLPFELGSPVALAVNGLGIAFNALLIAAAAIVVRRSRRIGP